MKKPTIAMMSLLILVLTLGAVGCGGDGATPTPTTPPTPTHVDDAGKISWNEAKDHIGEITTVCGLVVNADYYPDQGNITVFDMGVPYPDPDRFGVIIPGEHRLMFPEMPESYYADKRICISGRIIEHNNIAVIEVTNASQIRFVAD